MDVCGKYAPEIELSKRVFRVAIATCVFAVGIATLPGRADEIRLKDGKKLYGVIVAYEDNMFRIKTDYGFVLVEKDKIASIIPSTPAGTKDGEQPVAKKKTPAPVKSAPSAEPAVASGTETNPDATTASARPPVEGSNREKLAPKITNTAVKPELPAKPRRQAHQRPR